MPLSSSFLAVSISPAGPPVPAVLRLSSNCAWEAAASVAAAVGHPVVVEDQIGQHAEERQHDHEYHQAALAQPEMSRRRKTSIRTVIAIQIQMTQAKKIRIVQKMLRNG